jgi:hypothetical protein
MTLDLPLDGFHLDAGARLADGRIVLDGGGARLSDIPLTVGLHVFEFDIELAPGVPPPSARAEVFRGQQVFASAGVTTRAKRLALPVNVVKDGPVSLSVVCEAGRLELRSVAVREMVSSETARPREVDQRRLLQARLQRLLGLRGAEHGPRDDPSAELFDGGHMTFVPVAELHRHGPLFRAIGVSPVALSALFLENNTDRLLRSGEAPEELLDGAPRIANGFQEQIVRDGALIIRSPFDAEPVGTRNGLPVPTDSGLMAFVYEFFEGRPFVVGTSTGWTGAVSFVWFLDADLVVHHDAFSSNWAGAEEVIRNYLALCAAERSRLVRHRRRAESSVALVGGFVANMGHYFWNDVGGIERMLRRTGLQGVSAVIAARSDWLSIREVFADEPAPELIEVQGHDEVFDLVADRGLLPVRSVATRTDAAIAERIRRRGEIKLKAEAPDRAARLVELTSDGAYVLFVNLRAHNKVWLEQEEGVLRCVAALRRLHPRLLVYLDGYRDCAPLVGALRERDPGGVTWVDGTGAPFAETLGWAYRCDFFLAVIGSGLVPLTWLASKPGVCYGDHRHLAQMNWWGRVRPDHAPFRWPSREQVRDREDKFHSDFSLDPGLVEQMVLELQAELGFAEGAPALAG